MLALLMHVRFIYLIFVHGIEYKNISTTKIFHQQTHDLWYNYNIIYNILYEVVTIEFFLSRSSGSWKSKSFKAYNFDALGVPPTRGHFHPLMKVRAEIRQIFLEMG